MKTSFYLTEDDLDIIEEWKDHLRYRTKIEVIRYALRRLGAASQARKTEDGIINID